GVGTVRRIAAAAGSLGVGTLTLFAFSADNWRRPPEEVETLMRLLGLYLRHKTGELIEAGIRLSIIGRRDRLPAPLTRAIGAAERATATGAKLRLRIALDYSGREAIANAAAHWPEGAPASRDQFAALLVAAMGDCTYQPVDLLIRTGGERRLS